MIKKLGHWDSDAFSAKLGRMSYLINCYALAFTGKVICIVGHSFIYLAEKRAAERVYMRNLAMSKELFRVFCRRLRPAWWVMSLSN